MDIKKLSNKLERNKIEVELNKESLNYPVLSFNVLSDKFRFFYEEDFVRRTKFHKKYNTILEINAHKESNVSNIKNIIKETLSCKTIIKEGKIYSNVSKIKEDTMIGFINKLK